jgi:homoserine kinase
LEKEIRVFCPGTVSNVSCGFDVLGYCLDHIGDEMVVRPTSEKGIKITKIEGYDLPLETHKNVAGVSALAVIEDYKPEVGFEIEIYKRIKPGSGIGSSAASAAGSVFAISQLLGSPYSQTELTQFAMKGEALASQSEHADNLAPAIFGGFVLVKSLQPLEIIDLPSPDELYTVIIHPQIEIKTAEARAILPKEITMQSAIAQWSNLGSLVHALHTSDYALMKRSLVDAVVEPHRKKLIPHFDEVKQIALSHDALGFGISGSGPSMFALTKGKSTAITVEQAMRAFYHTTEIEFETYMSKVNNEGIKTLS